MRIDEFIAFIILAITVGFTSGFYICSNLMNILGEGEEEPED